MTAGRLLEWIGEMLRNKIRCILHIYIGGGRINKVEKTEELNIE